MRRINCILFVSSNKDNKDIEGFKQRKESFISNKNAKEVLLDFERFIEEGVDGEICRLYVSVNDRNKENILKELLHQLIESRVDLFNIESEVASIAATKECADGNTWLFDFDSNDESVLSDFMKDMFDVYGVDKYSVGTRKTINGYHIVVDEIFDYRELLEKYPFVELKKDAYLLGAWGRKSD